ncbi:hypothetical protein BB8028_0010g00310 [Beauveria bassiana]|uniref:Uncharacterized protein n=1 Tax=Beauveria bassiana TaxID=176275 RepID=A0A2S7YQE1_BEABA|nr:hypothetical protein BB8028_0010g00310 [Beauveria bassiana]
MTLHKMALDLCIHACIQKPRHRLHPPPANTPLRIRIQGPLETIEKLLPDVKWHNIVSFPQPGGVELARLTHEALYGKEVHAETRCRLVVRDEYLAWAMSERRPLSYIDYYGVTFDHLVSPDDPDPEVLVINIIELDSVGGIYSDGGLYASQVLAFPVDPMEYVGKKVLAVPRCCQHKKGTQDRMRINDEVKERDKRLAGSR